MSSHLPPRTPGRPISPDERSGVLAPGNLARYAATWITPAPSVATVVDQFWHVAWDLPASERTDQRIIDLPAITLTIEFGDVPAPMVLTGVQTGAWRRIIHGRGRVFAVRLRPAGLAVVSDLIPGAVRDRTIPVTARLDARLHALMQEIRDQPSVPRQTAAAERALTRLLLERPAPPKAILANAVLDELRARTRNRSGADVAEQLGVSERTVERALRDTIGHGPKWVSRRIRLQEVAQALATRPEASVAQIAADLDYADQSHLTADFRAVSGITPGSYRRRLGKLRR